MVIGAITIADSKFATTENGENLFAMTIMIGKVNTVAAIGTLTDSAKNSLGTNFSICFLKIGAKIIKPKVALTDRAKPGSFA